MTKEERKRFDNTRRDLQENPVIAKQQNPGY